LTGSVRQCVPERFCELMCRVAKSISNLGDLYTVLQMFVLGAHLRSKRCAPSPTVRLSVLRAGLTEAADRDRLCGR
jgi:hypothetical protein